MGEPGANPTCPEPLPERWCAHCSGTDCIEKVPRPFKRMAKSDGDGDGSGDSDRSTTCRCRACGRTFAAGPGFYGRHYSAGWFFCKLGRRTKTEKYNHIMPVMAAWQC